MAKIVIASGPGQGLSYKLSAQDAILGRLSTNNIPLPDTQASRQNSRIFVENGIYYIEDMASRNGTWVNGKQIERQALAHQDSIKIGDTTLTFLAQDQSPDVSPLVEMKLPTADTPPPLVEEAAKQTRQSATPLAPLSAGRQETVRTQYPASAVAATRAKPDKLHARAETNKAKHQAQTLLASDLPWGGRLLLTLGLLSLLLLLTWISRWLTLALLE